MELNIARLLTQTRRMGHRNYEKQHVQNVVEIAETYNTLNENELWTEDKDQLEQEIKTIIDKKEKDLKEQKRKKLETLYDNRKQQKQN